MVEFILASGNPHKAEEFAILFDSKVISVKVAEKKIDVVEDGDSYQANALKKAEGFYKEFGKPVLADDSGLNVEALPNELGIYSARFGGEGLSDRDRIDHLLKKLEGEENRKAHFSCVLCAYLNPQEIFFFEGRVNGSILAAPAGEAGFGYDPVFCPEDVEGSDSLAMMPDWKDKNSHRAHACRFAQKFFRERVCQS